MGTSAVLNGVEQPKKEFPLVAKTVTNGNNIVLFTSNNIGCVIHGLDYGSHLTGLQDCFDTSVWQILDSVTITFKS